MKCRHCGALVEQTFVDLGYAPPSNAYLSKEDLSRPETYFPLRVKVCDDCWLVQTEDYAGAEDLFTKDYAYFSSTSSTWLAHAQLYADTITERLSLDSRSFVIEVASNDGYLLRNFLRVGIPSLGIEPTENTAAAAEDLGLTILREFLTESVAHSIVAEFGKADLVVANNVYAHVPDINDFTRGLATLLKPDGVVTVEFPHLLNLVKHCQFDTIYHEHFSYLSLGTVKRIFESVGLSVWDVELLETHGGSLRVYGTHRGFRKESPKVAEVITAEVTGGLEDTRALNSFQFRVDEIKNNLLQFLLKQNQQGRLTVAYGAAAKGNTLLNYCGIRSDLVRFVFDGAASKQGRFMPGSHIPILAPEHLNRLHPDFVLVLPWNIALEIHEAIGTRVPSSSRSLVAVPELKFLS